MRFPFLMLVHILNTFFIKLSRNFLSAMEMTELFITLKVVTLTSSSYVGLNIISPYRFDFIVHVGFLSHWVSCSSNKQKRRHGRDPSIRSVTKREVWGW